MNGSVGRRRRLATALGVVLAPSRLRAQFYDCDSSLADWAVTQPSSAYTWGTGVPQSCNCAESDVSPSSCDVYTCGCTCDLTAGLCDYNCCCDTECTDAEITRFTELDACIPQIADNTYTVKCYQTGQLQAINAGGSLESAPSAVDELLCVQYDNSDSKGYFYQDPGDTDAATLWEQAGDSGNNYQTYFTDSTAVLATEGGVTFDKGDRIPAAFASGSGVVAAFGGYMPLPAANDDGSCNEANYVAFETPVLENSCSRRVTNLSAECPDAFGAWRFSESLYVATDGAVVPSSSGGTGDYIHVAVSSVTWRDWDSGEELDFSAAYGCDAFYFDGSDTSSTCAVVESASGGSTNVSALSWPACVNALVGVCYTVWHDGSGGVTGATAALTVTNVPLDTSGSPNATATALLEARQEYTVQFRGPAPAAGRSEDLGNLVNRSRSGNPGYLVGLPVLAGTLVSGAGGDAYVAAAQSGLQILGGGGGSCDVPTTNAVLFGYDAMGCCAMELTLAELKELCEGGGPYMQADGTTPVALNITQALVGAFGSADPLDIGQWLTLDGAAGGSSLTSTSSWDGVTGVCSGLVTSVGIRLLHARVGPKAAPQSKIVAAEAAYATDDWTWSVEDGARQNFLLCATVSFVAYDAAAQEYTPPPPPVVFKLPWDVFYPFSISAAAQGVGANGALPWLLLLLCQAAAAVMGATVLHTF